MPVRRWLLLLSVPLLLTAGRSAFAQEIDDASPEARVEVQDHGLKIQVGQSTYLVEAPSAENRQLFDSLPEQDKKAFSANRTLFMGIAARALQAMKYGFGAGVVVKDRLRYALDVYKDRRLQKKMNELDDNVREDYLAARERFWAERLAEEDAQARLTLREKSEKVITSILTSLDHKLWSQAPVFAHSNEFGVMASAGLQLVGGAGNRGWGGLFDIGISIGFNRDSRALVIQIFRDFEKFQSTVMKAVFVTGLVGKAGIYVANQAEGHLTHKGSGYYPPMVPGFSASTPDSFTSGFSSGGPFTWPPSPVADFITYSTRLDQQVLLRVSVSPLLKGFVRIQTGIDRHTLDFLVEPVAAAINSVRGLFIRTRLCEAVFLN